MAEVLALGPFILTACALSVLAGAVLQRLTGQGFGMISAPMLAIWAPEFMPATLLIVGLILGLSSSAMNLSAITRSEIPAGFAGRLTGAVVAALIAAAITDQGLLAYAVALLVYLGIALSLTGIRVPINQATLFTAGVAGGIMGTLTAVGAPPMALLYQHVETRRSAAMQNLFFFWGMMVSIPALAFVGLVEWRHIAFAIVLAPTVPLALWIAKPLSLRMERRAIRPWALGLAGCSATVLLVNQFLS